ncbi:MAG: flagellar basal body L-ring protein FlgH [Fimbriimonadales bacterium]
MKSLALLLFFGIANFSYAQSPGSLWSDSARVPYMDRTAAKPGDVLTIIVSENSSASSSATTQGSKSDKGSVTAGAGPILRALIPNLGIEDSFQSSGSGSTTRKGSIAGRLTVMVKKVLPNGSLLIEGTRFTQVNKETQKWTIQGIVRPDDIRSDNTIFSEFVAEATIRYDGKGTVGDRQRKGIISTLLDWLF